MRGLSLCNSLHIHSITIIFLSPSHPLPYFTYYVALMYCHTSSGNASESGAHCARFLIFGYFLSLLSEIASAIVHEPRRDWFQFLHPTLGAMGKTTSEPPGRLAHQLFTTGGSPWLHTNCLINESLHKLRGLITTYKVNWLYLFETIWVQLQYAQTVWPCTWWNCLYLFERRWVQLQYAHTVSLHTWSNCL